MSNGCQPYPRAHRPTQYIGVVILLKNHNKRERVRLRLLAARIYPAILWPLDTKDATSAGRDFAARQIFLNADFR